MWKAPARAAAVLSFCGRIAFNEPVLSVVRINHPLTMAA